jgi:VWFA-related protein
MTAKLTPIPLLAAVMIFAQSMDPDEFRAESKAYTPPARADMIRAQVNLVEIPVVVRDGNHTVSGLERADFQVVDSGHPREIVSFSVESRTAPGSSAASNADPAHAPAPAPTPSLTPLPPSRRYIALLFDDLNMNNADLARVRTAAKKYVKESLSAEDRVAVFTTASPRSANFTSDMEDVSKQIDELRPHPHAGDNSGLSLACPSFTFYEAYLIGNNLDNELLLSKAQEYIGCAKVPVSLSSATIMVQAKAKALWFEAKFNSEATLRVVGDLVSGMARLEGRKAIVLTSSGFLTGELEPKLEEITHRAVRAGIVINSLEARGLWTPMGDIEHQTAYRTQGAAMRARGHDQLVQMNGQQVPDDGLATLAYGTGGRFFENTNDLYAGIATWRGWRIRCTCSASRPATCRMENITRSRCA